MTYRNDRSKVNIFLIFLALAYGFGFDSFAQNDLITVPTHDSCHVFMADRVFDGFNRPLKNVFEVADARQKQAKKHSLCLINEHFESVFNTAAATQIVFQRPVNLLDNAAVLFKGNKIVQVGDQDQLSGICNRAIDLGDATILPGFIESHAHLAIQNIPHEKVLRHGITTARDTGGPLRKSTGGNGTLRVLSAGPIIQAVDGYPLNIFAHDASEHQSKYDVVGVTVATIEEAETVVKDLVAGGSTIIKIALEPGGEAGAPWMSSHGHGEPPKTPWPLLSLDIVKAIVAKAHALNKKVTAHVGENVGVELALNAGVDEWTHIPCAEIREDLLHRAVAQNVTFVTTVDTLSACTGAHANMHKLAHIIAHSADTKSKFIYGSEIGHDNVPWGINGEEMALMLHLISGETIDFMDVLNVFKAATSEAGKNLGKPLLGTLLKDAPADIIAVRGNPFQRFKLLEYPDLVISGGRTIVNDFKKNKKNH